MSFGAWVQGYFAEQDEGSTPHTPMDPSEQPEEKLSFALGNGSVGILAVKGRKVPPSSSLPTLHALTQPPQPTTRLPYNTHTECCHAFS